MRWIALRSVWAVSAVLLTATVVAAQVPPGSGRGGLRPVKDRTRLEAPEWAAPPIDVAPPWVGDGFPSKDRDLRLTVPRVKVLSIEAVPEPSAWEPAPPRRAK